MRAVGAGWCRVVVVGQKKDSLEGGTLLHKTRIRQRKRACQCQAYGLFECSTAQNRTSEWMNVRLHCMPASEQRREKHVGTPRAPKASTPSAPSAAADTSPTPWIDAVCLRGASSSLSKLHRRQPRGWLYCTPRALCAGAPFVCAAIDRYVVGMA
jgi:hypothetical protein